MDVKENVLSYLEVIGYKKITPDDKLIDVIRERVVNSILTLTNQKELPEQLNHVVTMRVLGEFLQIKQISNNLNIETLNFDLILTEKVVGSTKTTYSKPTTMLSSVEMFNKAIVNLTNFGRDEVIKFRRIRW